MWTYFTTVYFLKNRDENGLLEEGDFYNFLNKMIPFIWTYALVNPGVNALRTPVYAEMVNIINGTPVDFESFKFEKQMLRIFSIITGSTMDDRLQNHSLLGGHLKKNLNQL